MGNRCPAPGMCAESPSWASFTLHKKNTSVNVRPGVLRVLAPPSFRCSQSPCWAFFPNKKPGSFKCAESPCWAFFRNKGQKLRVTYVESPRMFAGMSSQDDSRRHLTG